MSKMKVVKFNMQDQPEFYKELRGRVNNYFTENNISRYANSAMKFKTAFMICLYFLPMFAMITGLIQTTGLMFLMWILMGFGMAGIGLSIMHDANHGSYSKNKRVNSALGFLINFIGGNHVNWKIQHNVMHHSYTNIDEFDGDLEAATFRFSPEQERKSIFKYQAFYAPFLYGLMTIYWLTSKDFLQLIDFKKRNILESQGVEFKRAITLLSINKAWYVLLTIIMPLVMLPMAWWQVMLGFFVMHFICGLMLALIFQPAHVLEETAFYEVKQTGSVENHWAIHQLRTTANFAKNSKLFSWFIGGLNFQIEHHLFPNICHVHYPKISHIVKQTAEEFNLPYHQHETFGDALKSHFSLLYDLGTGNYDKRMAKA